MTSILNEEVFKKILEDHSEIDHYFNLIRYKSKFSYKRIKKAMIEPLEKNQKFMEFYQKKYLIKNLDLKYLEQLSENTLGYQYVAFLKKKNLSEKYYPIIKIRDPLSYTKEVLWSTHDFWHVVCNYGTSLEEELALQAFTCGQIQSPLSLAMLGTGLIKIALNKPEEIKESLNLIFEGFYRGQNAHNFLLVDWVKMCPKPLDEVRKMLRVEISV